MAEPDKPLTPIYDQLITERGDVPTQARKTAEETQREADEALDFSAVGASLP